MSIEPNPEAADPPREVGPHEWAMCGKKRRYPSRRRAIAAAARAVKRAGYLRTYRCPYCHGFHLTHAEPRRTPA